MTYHYNQDLDDLVNETAKSLTRKWSNKGITQDAMCAAFEIMAVELKSRNANAPYRQPTTRNYVKKK
jgi:hypothetical protein